MWNGQRWHYGFGGGTGYGRPGMRSNWINVRRIETNDNTTQDLQFLKRLNEQGQDWQQWYSQEQSVGQGGDGSRNAEGHELSGLHWSKENKHLNRGEKRRKITTHWKEVTILPMCSTQNSSILIKIKTTYNDDNVKVSVTNQHYNRKRLTKEMW